MYHNTLAKLFISCGLEWAMSEVLYNLLKNGT